MISVAAAVAFVIWHFEVSPIYLLLAGAAGGALWVAAKGKEVQR
jgi:hypothetical protein